MRETNQIIITDMKKNPEMTLHYDYTFQHLILPFLLLLTFQQIKLGMR